MLIHHTVGLILHEQDSTKAFNPKATKTESNRRLKVQVPNTNCPTQRCKCDQTTLSFSTLSSRPYPKRLTITAK